MTARTQIYFTLLKMAHKCLAAARYVLFLYGYKYIRIILANMACLISSILGNLKRAKWYFRVPDTPIKDIQRVELDKNGKQKVYRQTPNLERLSLQLGLLSRHIHFRWVPVTITRCVLRFRMGQRPPATESSCERCGSPA
jgi:hypothetical protein